MCVYTHTHISFHIYAMEYYLTTTEKEILSFATAWVNLEGILLSDISQTQKDKYFLLLLLLSRFSRVPLCATPETAAH